MQHGLEQRLLDRLLEPLLCELRASSRRGTTRSILADEQRKSLHWGLQQAAGRDPDVVLLVVDDEKLSRVTGKKGARLLEPYADSWARCARRSTRLPFLIVVTKMDKVQAADSEATWRMSNGALHRPVR